MNALNRLVSEHPYAVLLTAAVGAFLVLGLPVVILASRAQRAGGDGSRWAVDFADLPGRRIRHDRSHAPHGRHKPTPQAGESAPESSRAGE